MVRYTSVKGGGGMTELCHSRLNRDVKWRGVPVDYGAGKECVLVIVFECTV